MTRTPLDLDLPDLHGRRALVTGASDGIGLRIATRLAGAGAELVLPVRSATKGEAARTAILRAHPAAEITLATLDLASLESVRGLTDRVRSEGRPLHLLVANAGVMTPPTRQTTVDGFELQFGTNHLGHAALISGLLPLLRAGSARVVSQVSIAASRGGILWDDVNSERTYDAMAAYRQSKIAVGLFGVELERRSRDGGWGITSALAHPGIAPTSLLAARPELERERDTMGVRVIRWLSARGILVGTPESAALPALVAATVDRIAPGTMIGPGGPGHLGGAPAEQRLFASLTSPEAAARLWELTERALGAPIAAD